MSNYFAHKRAKTSQHTTEGNQKNHEKRWNCIQASSYKKQLQTNYFSQDNRNIGIKLLQQPVEPKLAGSLVTPSKYSRFPCQTDFLLKTRKDQQFHCLPNPQLLQKFQYNKKNSQLKKVGKKSDSRNMFVSDQLAAQKLSSKIPLRVPSFIKFKKVRSKDDLPTLLGVKPEKPEEGHLLIGCTKLKETISTLNLNATSISQVSKKVEDQPNCLDLSFEMEELMNRSFDEKMASDKEDAKDALRELEFLLDS